MTTPNVIAINPSTMPYVSSGNLHDWTKLSDDNNFNPEEGVYQVTESGIYEIFVNIRYQIRGQNDNLPPLNISLRYNNSVNPLPQDFVLYDINLTQAVLGGKTITQASKKIDFVVIRPFVEFDYIFISQIVSEVRPNLDQMVYTGTELKII